MGTTFWTLVRRFTSWAGELGVPPPAIQGYVSCLFPTQNKSLGLSLEVCREEHKVEKREREGEETE